MKRYKWVLFLILSLEIFRILSTITAKFLFSLCTPLKNVIGLFISFLKLFKLFHKASKTKLVLDLLYCFSQEIWLEDWWKLIFIGKLRSLISYPWEILKKFSVTSNYLCIFNNTLPASCVSHIIRDFLTCYPCLDHSSMILSSPLYFMPLFILIVRNIKTFLESFEKD